MIIVNDGKKYLGKDVTFEDIMNMVVIERKNNEIYCVYKCVFESSTNKGYIVVFNNGNVSYETLSHSATVGQVFNYDEFRAYQCRNIDIDADVVVTY